MEQGYQFETLLQQFFAGRLGFDALRRQAKALVDAEPGSREAMTASLQAYVNLGRLPPDLAQHLLPAAAGAPAAAPIAQVSGPPPLSAAPSAGSAIPLPPGLISGIGDDDRPDAHMERQVDELVLNAMLGDFRKFRTEARNAPRERPDDTLLSNSLQAYRGARMRREAQLAEAGQGRSLAIEPDKAKREYGAGDVLVNRFVLDTEIGSGGMGHVYKAVDRRRLEAGSPDPYVAIKLISARFRENPQSLRALESEARKAQVLAHPNIVSVHDFERDGRAAFIVMELLDGESLLQRLEGLPNRKMSLEAARPIVLGIASGLANAHGHGVIHCDLKPSNVFLTSSGGVKVLDFGIATSSRQGAFAAETLGAMTIAYASPEMLEGAPRDPRDDIFAFACLIYAMLAGRHPFDRKPAVQARDRGMTPPPIDGLPNSAQAALFAGLAFERELRPADVMEFASSLYRRGLFARLFGTKSGARVRSARPGSGLRLKTDGRGKAS